MMPGMFPTVADVVLPTLAYRGFIRVDSVTNNHTHTSYTSNDASPTRRLIACVGYSGSEITGVTIFGVAATLVDKANNSVRRCSVWIADVPTGTSGDVVLSLTSSAWTSWVTLYSAVDLVSATPIGTNTATGTTSVSMSASASDGGVAVAVVYGQGLSASWSAMTEDEDDNVGTVVFSSASLSPTTPPTLSPVATIGSGSVMCGVTATFR